MDKYSNLFRHIYIRQLFCCAILSLFVVNQVFAQQNERRIFLVDLSGSLKTNKMFEPMKDNLKASIGSVEEDVHNSIVLATFTDYIMAVSEVKATSEGKEKLIKFIDTCTLRNGDYYTSIYTAVDKFHKLVKDDCINYMFLYTDGEDNDPKTKDKFIPKLQAWENDTKGKNCYGFYVIVHKEADKPEIRKSIESQKNFWIVPTAKVQIKVCDIPSKVSYNLADQNKTLTINGRFAQVPPASLVHLEIDDNPYYTIESQPMKIQDGKLTFAIKGKPSSFPPANSVITARVCVENLDEYSFICPDEINIECINKEERTLNISIE